LIKKIKISSDTIVHEGPSPKALPPHQNANRNQASRLAAAHVTQRSQAAACSAADHWLLSAVCIGIIATLPCEFYLLLARHLLVILPFGFYWSYCHLDFIGHIVIWF